MLTIENLVVLVLLVLAFYAGKRISDSYNNERITELEYQLRLSAAKEGVYIAPPARKRMPIGQPFMDKLKANGRATQRIDNNQT